MRERDECDGYDQDSCSYDAGNETATGKVRPSRVPLINTIRP